MHCILLYPIALYCIASCCILSHRIALLYPIALNCTCCTNRIYCTFSHLTVPIALDFLTTFPHKRATKTQKPQKKASTNDLASKTLPKLRLKINPPKDLMAFSSNAFSSNATEILLKLRQNNSANKLFSPFLPFSSKSFCVFFFSFFSSFSSSCFCFSFCHQAFWRGISCLSSWNKKASCSYCSTCCCFNSQIISLCAISHQFFWQLRDIFFTLKSKTMFEANNIDNNVVLKTTEGSNNVSLSVLNCQQVGLAKSYTNN